MNHINKARIAAEKVIQEIIKEEGIITFPINPFKILKEKNVIITFSDFDKLEGLLLFDGQKESVVSINLNRLLYKYVPYPEYAEVFRTHDNLIVGGQIQPISVLQLSNKIEELVLN